MVHFTIIGTPCHFWPLPSVICFQVAFFGIFLSYGKVSSRHKLLFRSHHLNGAVKCSHALGFKESRNQ